MLKCLLRRVKIEAEGQRVRIVSKEKAKRNCSNSSAGNGLRLYYVVYMARHTVLEKMMMMNIIIMINKRKLLLEIVQLCFIMTLFVTFQADLFPVSQTFVVRP
jgi:hypothetical protein